MSITTNIPKTAADVARQLRNGDVDYGFVRKHWQTSDGKPISEDEFDTVAMLDDVPPWVPAGTNGALVEAIEIAQMEPSVENLLRVKALAKLSAPVVRRILEANGDEPAEVIAGILADEVNRAAEEKAGPELKPGYYLRHGYPQSKGGHAKGYLSWGFRSPEYDAESGKIVLRDQQTCPALYAGKKFSQNIRFDAVAKNIDVLPRCFPLSVVLEVMNAKPGFTVDVTEYVEIGASLECDANGEYSFPNAE